MGHKGRELALEECLGYSATRALDAAPRGVEKGRLNIRVPAPVAHVRHGRERAGLEVQRAPLARGVFAVGAKARVGVDARVVVAESLAAQDGRVDILDAGGRGLRRGQVGRGVTPGTRGRPNVLGNLARVVAGAGEFIHAKFASGKGGSTRERGNGHFLLY
jgi:hypothetical protein